MKKFLLTIAVVAIGFAANAQKNVIKANPLGLAFGVADLSYERAVSDKSSFEIGLSYAGADVTSGSEKISASAIGAEGKFKFYFSSDKDAPRGWYAAPFVSYASASAENNGGDDVGFSAFSGGALAGYQWVFGGGDSGFALDLNFGAQYVSASAKGGSSVSIDGFLPRLGVSLGYAW
ncbi:uncharacterized protein DUF3575 [Tenacibaculum skagerrakense]|uniref:Uncharacterized protein DUF3575 n=1 Tax=Tenacibaculum skagerrakense TaxID=186571 RepID=A0A4R2NUK3_9FLAO|nr:DUF3575 domain-containing protein [Tenacibaculum skagerrakense]TCP25769.1 uncharacterized protein DUF3575 [Tenacibaculum skagerrakense]